MVRGEGKDPFVPSDIGSFLGTGMALKHRCIVSRDPLPVRVLLAALATTVSQRDQLEIIVDRRRGGSFTNQASIERRHPSHFAHLLERVGVAIVPARVAQSAEPSLPTPPIERSDRSDLEEHIFKRLNEYRRRQKVRLNSWAILAGLMGVILVSLVQAPTMKTLMSWVRPAGPWTSHDRVTAPAAAAAVPQVAEAAVQKPARATATTTRPAARASRRAAARSPSASPDAEGPEAPPAAKGQATTPEQPENHGDNPYAVIDWLLKR